MKALLTLSKLHKRRIDALRKALGDLETQRDQLLQALESLAEEMKREVALASEQVEMSRFFGDYAKRIRRREGEINKEIKELVASMDLLREKLAEEFSEMKKYDITRENRMKAKAEKEKRKETELLDEMAIQGFRRKSDQ